MIQIDRTLVRLIILQIKSDQIKPNRIKSNLRQQQRSELLPFFVSFAFAME